jgi:hypothetical protein
LHATTRTLFLAGIGDHAAMMSPDELAACSIGAWTAGLWSLIFYGLLTGAIRTQGMLRDDPPGPLTADRAQLLVVSLGGAMAYIGSALAHVGDAKLPEVPAVMVASVSSSQLIYLVPKFMRRKPRK